MGKIEIGDFKLDPDKGIIATFIGNADDFEDGPNFEVKFKLVGSTIKVTETMKF